VFNGSRYRTVIAPRIASFIREMQALPANEQRPAA
jgi:poly(3-hydroxybutyrate) depolymerase